MEHMMTTEDPVKPFYRGVLHQWAAPVALGAGLVMVAVSPNMRAMLASIIYVCSLFLLLSVSATYHRVKWGTAQQELYRRLDHSCIFILIGGTYTAPCLLALSPEAGREVLLVVWGGSLFATLRIFLWRKAPRWVVAAPYLLLGWTGAFYRSDFISSLLPDQLVFYFLGGLAYTTGAIFYVLRRPNLRPGIFGFHELFHAMTIIASVFHFAATLSLVVHA
jgi:hemolysin III